ncbi:MAG: hypothetical protein J6X56_09355 [Ruminococcus sp.]|nr:hypothetical protein [Ruminococcus sp.]
MNKLRKRIVSAACAVSMMLSAVSSTIFSASLAADVPIDGLFAEEQAEFADYTRQSFELYPNDNDTEQVITLEGSMPEGIEAEAVDVSEEHDAVVAYDINLTDRGMEYQPDEEHPVFVEISAPAIAETENIEVWHIRDDGERECVTDFIFEDGRLSFYATGFSVYEIIEVTGQSSTGGKDNASDVSDLTSLRGNSGFYIYYKSGIYVTNKLNSNDCLIESNNASDAAVWYFEKEEVGGTAYYRIYTYVGNEKRYIHTKSNNVIELSSAYDLFEISKAKEDITFYFKKKGDGRWLQHSNGGGGIRYYTDNKNDENSQMKLYFRKSATTVVEPTQLDGKTYGLFHYTDSSTSGNALMSGGDSHSLVKLILKAEGNNRVLYVDQDNEIDRWKFTYDSDGKYLISTDDGYGTKYLCITDDGLSTTTDIAGAGRFVVESNSGSMICISSDGRYITFDPDTNGFTTTVDGGSSNVWLWTLDKASLADSDLITFSADRVSISDVQDGQKVILYIRIWNEQDLKYDMYAVDHNGALYPCYASGGKILWLGDGTGSLEWIFTEYVDPVTKKPNYYYELYNPYSEKYIAPQLGSSQVLADEHIGINMQGRRNGDFYSEILAWDESCYKYIGLRPNEEKTALEPCSDSTALPFYFATLEELNLSDRLHDVPTLDNNEFGIKMKMVDFNAVSGQTYGGPLGADVTWDYFGGDLSRDKLVRGMFSTDLKDDGYPVISGPDTNNSIGKSASGIFNTPQARTVNHLFLEKVYDSSGYFEFDSCQNFATLKKINEDGTISFNTNGDETNFTVYRELGTNEHSGSDSLKHGQFFPYDTIKPGVYPNTHSENLFNAMKEELSNSDPRKYEQLHLIQTDAQKEANYYFGMEMEASFVQTPSGLDAWGHDIVFEFTGDDDFWLYVDDELILDFGGMHSALQGKVNFRTGEVTFDHTGKDHGPMKTMTLREIFVENYKKRNPNATQAEIDAYLADKNFADGENIFKDYSTHTMKIFYMERGGNASNLYMRFNLAAVTPGHVVVSKALTGEGASEINTDFVEYPFQIYYTLPDGEGGAPGEEKLLGNDDDHVRVSYQNSNQSVEFVRKYRPPGFTEEEAYENIYFINPTKNAEISFPDDTISYRIVECAVDSTVYGKVKINGEEVPPERKDSKHSLISYSSEINTADQQPNIAFENCVNRDVVRDLQITKKLKDDNGNDITDDPAKFDFRLYLSSVDVAADDMQLANMYDYYVLSPNKKLCVYDSSTRSFAETAVDYSYADIEDIEQGRVEGLTKDDITFRTSGFGAISGIPAGYTICVPKLPVGTIFKVKEDVKSGYGLQGYERIFGDMKLEDGTVVPIASYALYDNNPMNVGKVIAGENPQLEVINKKGYGLNVNKKWSDLDITTSHSEIYTAVYVDGELLDGSVRKIESPSVSAYYFWTTLKPYSDGTPRTSFDGYEVREVLLSGTPTVADDGTVTGYSSITPLSSGEKQKVTAARIAEATPAGENADKQFDYIVAYSKGSEEASTRTDTIINNREGGVAVRLFKWDSNVPLSGGSFELSDSSGNVIGNYTSASDGTVTMLYNYEIDKIYTLRQRSAPRGFVGLQKPLCFKVNADETVSMYYENGAEWGTASARDIGWVDSKEGSDGLTAFVDVYNKPFNFKIVKTDDSDHGIKLSGAHFALYKQRPTTIAGDVKRKEPMEGFEDLTTSNGEVVVCGGSSGRTIDPGASGSVYFLTETKSPFNYAQLEDDIIFYISAIGVPSMRGGVDYGRLVETADSYIYTLSVPNVKEDIVSEFLTIEKKVEGPFGERNKEFSFTVEIENAGSGDGFKWAKNGEEQPAMARTGGSFNMKHNDKVEIALPMGVKIKVSENSAGYEPSFRLDGGEAVHDDNLTFTFNGSAELLVTNTLNGTVPSGVADTIARSAALVMIPMVPIGIALFMRRKKRQQR